jgi:hypothetical protein
MADLDSREVLRKLTSGQTLNNEERAVLGMAPVATPTTYNQRVLAAIQSGNQANVDVNANPINTGQDVLPDYGDGGPVDGDGKILGTDVAEIGQGEDTGLITPDTPAEDVTSLLAQQKLEFEKRLAEMQAAMTAQINAAITAQTAAAEKAKADATAAARKSAFEITKERFTNAGMKELGDEITAIYKGTGVDRFGKKFDEIPTTGEGFYLALINTKSYYDRFGKVNEDRLAKGFKALDERTIIGMEDEYQQVLQAYNQPAGFYDAPADYQTFLKNNYSKADVASALQASADFVASKDPTIRKELQTLFGIDDAALTAYYADPKKGQAILENIAGKNMNTAAALIAGLSKEDATVGQQYGAGSFTYEQNRQRYSQAAQNLETTGGLAKIYGENFGAKEAIAAEFGDAEAQAQATRIRQTGLAAFGGTSAIGTKALRTTGQVS